MKDIGEEVWELIQKNADRGGMVAMEAFWNDCEALPVSDECIEVIIGNIRNTGFIWFWGDQMIVVKPIMCPNCGPVHELITIHMLNCPRA
jgi:hypothetical protein